MTKTGKIGLTEFVPHEKSFAARFVDAVFDDREDKKPIGDIFADAFSVSGYMPDVIEAQHWAADILNSSDLEPSEEHGSLDLIGEIFHRCFVPYDQGEMNLEDAKAAGVKMAEEVFEGSDQELMFDGAPSKPVWFASHIYRLFEEAEKEIDDAVDERKELDELAGDVDDYYVGTSEADRIVERRHPFVALLNTGVKIGFLYRDAWWKANHEEAALGYYAQAEARKKGSPKGGDATAQKFARLKRDCLGYFEQAFREKGAVFVGAPLNIVAHTICEIALRERPNDFVGPSGSPLSEQWFFETLEDLRAEGEFGPAILAATQKA